MEGTRIGAVMGEIRGRIAARGLSAGERLPSIRRLAATLSVSPSTVVEAYDRLAATGLIVSRPGSGFYVAGAPVQAAPDAERPRPRREIDPFWVSRQSLDAPAGALSPGCGWLPADWLPEAALRRAIRALARGEDALLGDYGPARGSPGLRRLLARQMAGEGIAAGADDILLTGSGTQALDLLCRLLLQPGDTVLVDDPCYFNFLALLRVHRVRVVGVPHRPGGPDVALFAEAVAAHRPRLYVTNSAVHNPTGATLSPQTAHRVLSIAAAEDVAIVEDDIFADFEPEPSPRLAALDGLSRVLRIGSFSKTLSASIRCGYIAARPDLVEALVDLQVATSFGGPSPAAAAIVEGALFDGSYRKHLGQLRARLDRRRREVAVRLETLGIRPWLMPRGGFHLWCRLPEGRDAGALARASLRHGVLLAPGDVFSAGRSAGAFMRFNVAQTDERAIAVLRRVLEEGDEGP
ncbi:PLP-dependent aminotransferase family protein [Aurantimonas sp. Leaf443]|uniref:aminotransferase-like domain-containing protein n=1 Tax=Aurantimonas sp. Leaf443 TaxID=1736378 RepID=UPI0006FD8A92|nr:PLP-dependent aminotransferase family protein [Aurantimonas sp. Leaf443]KQT83176.1 GntR family transcriptional regulator [Aurantimonas sp. Leaf443]